MTAPGRRSFLRWKRFSSFALLFQVGRTTPCPKVRTILAQRSTYGPRAPFLLRAIFRCRRARARASLTDTYSGNSKPPSYQHILTFRDAFGCQSPLANSSRCRSSSLHLVPYLKDLSARGLRGSRSASLFSSLVPRRRTCERAPPLADATRTVRLLRSRRRVPPRSKWITWRAAVRVETVPPAFKRETPERRAGLPLRNCSDGPCGFFHLRLADQEPSLKTPAKIRQRNASSPDWLKNQAFACLAAFVGNSAIAPNFPLVRWALYEPSAQPVAMGDCRICLIRMSDASTTPRRFILRRALQRLAQLLHRFDNGDLLLREATERGAPRLVCKQRPRACHSSDRS